MRRAPLGLLILAGLCAPIAACKREPDAAQPASSAPAAPDWPLRKAGLWRMAVSDGAAVVQTVEVCVDAKSDRKLSLMGPQINARMCAQHTATRQPDGGWSFTAVCEMGSGGRVSTLGSASGDLDRHYVVHADSATQGAALPAMNGKRSVTVDATWIGRCAAGQSGGEVMMPDGARLNVVDGEKGN